MYVWTDKTVEVWELHKLFAFAFVPGNGWEVTMAIIFLKNGCTWRQQQVLWWTFSSPASPLMHASCTIDKRECIQWPLDIVPGPQSGPYLLASNGHWFKVQWVSSCPRKKQCIHLNHWKPEHTRTIQRNRTLLGPPVLGLWFLWKRHLS